MNLTNPNRDRVQSSDRFENQQKQSGDQHVLPEGDRDQDPHRPHRISREDAQKIPSDQDPDDPAQQ